MLLPIACLYLAFLFTQCTQCNVSVEDAPASPMRDVLNRSSQDRGIAKASGDEEDKQNAKLVGANTAYARGLTPWYAGGMLI